MPYEIRRSETQVNEQLNRCAREVDAGRPGAADVAQFFDWLIGMTEEPVYAEPIEDDEEEL